MKFRAYEIVIVLISVIFLCSCTKSTREITIEDLNIALALEDRLGDSGFTLQHGDTGAVGTVYGMLNDGHAVPRILNIKFSGEDVEIPEINPGTGLGISFDDGRLSVIFPVENFIIPAYGQFSTLAVAYYYVPETDLGIQLILVCFQTDPEGSNAGLAVRSLDIEGIEMSAPFAVAIKIEELSGLMFYDEFIESSERYALAGSKEYNRGVLLLNRISDDTVLSTYLPWY